VKIGDVSNVSGFSLSIHKQEKQEKTTIGFRKRQPRARRKNMVMDRERKFTDFTD
jgi:hypothetical protein